MAGLHLLLHLLPLLLPYAPLGAHATCSQTIRRVDFDALLKLKAEVADPSNYLTQWAAGNRSEACCWTGVTCERSRVRALSMNGYTLQGALPSAIGSLSSLGSLSLSSNFLEGPVPSSWGLLTELQYLDLSFNFLNGSLEEFMGEGVVGNLKNLTALNLRSNGLEGTVPAAWGQLKKLQMLDLAQNNLTGSLEDFMSSEIVLNWEKLTSLDLSLNQLEGPIPKFWAKLNRLNFLDLSYNLLNGSLEVVSAFPSLLLLNMNANMFTGDLHNLPLQNMSNLVVLNLANNFLSGTFPIWIGNLKQLKGIDLSNNPTLPSSLPLKNASWSVNLEYVKLSSLNLQGTTPPALCSGKVTNLDLSSNNLHGSIPEFTGGKTSLEVNLSRNNFTGGLLQIVRNENVFSSLDLSYNRLSGDILSFSKMLCMGSQGSTSVPFFLNLTNNEFKGPLPSALGSCSSLQGLFLANNKFEGSVPQSLLLSIYTLNLRNNAITSLTRLPNEVSIKILDVGGNELSTVPPAVEEMSSLQELYLDSNQIKGPIPEFIGNLSNLKVLDLSNNPFSGAIPQTFARKGFTYDDFFGNYKFNSFIALTYMNLSHCQLTGEIPSNFGNLQRLQTLDLSSNQLSGDIPDLQGTILSLLNLSQNSLTGSVPAYLGNLSLYELDLSDNNLSGILPAELLFNLTLSKCGNYRPGNPNLQVVCIGGYVQNNASPPPPPPLPPLSSTSNGGLQVYVVVIISVGAAIVICVAIFLGYVFLRPKQPQKSQFAVKLEDYFVKQIPLQAICEATNNFSKENLLGEGGFGTVYKGTAKNGVQWAVKRAKTVSNQGLLAFQNEIDVMSRMNHKNLVKLLGFCDEDNEQILIYEFVANGTLKAALQLKDGTRAPLTFKQRLEIALGAAEGLSYLHTQAKPTIIHRDVKSDNILLDDKLQAKVSDFGLLRDNVDELALLSKTRVAGTHGYMDPEYYTHYRVTTKCDVYSFGVVLLELISGQSAVIKPTEDIKDVISLSNWALQRIRSTLGLSAVADPNLEGEYALEDMQTLASIAASCLQKSSAHRPEMADVGSQLRMLKAKVEGVQVRDVQPEEIAEVAVERSWFIDKGLSSGIVEESVLEGR